MTDYEKLEERRQMARRNYYAQMAMMGYDSGGNALDLVEVVRCRDCKYWKDQSCIPKWLPCSEIQTSGYWFCADGERSEPDA